MVAAHPRTPPTRLLATLLLAMLAIAAVAIGLAVHLLTADPVENAGMIPAAAIAGDATLRAPPPPPVEPVHYLELPRETARQINAAVPFSTAPSPAAAPLRLLLPDADTARAVDCLAAAAWYEAGDDAIGEEAVIQVVLNRMRHRAFPRSVCGVVFQGSERTTGCQFSFTCDGSLRRTPSPAAWARARLFGRAALNGFVFARVGLATHYHTDWVVPNWSAGVDKIAAVDTHLFFRWKGANGLPLAFRERHGGTEPIVPALAPLSPAHAATTPMAVAPSPLPAAAAASSLPTVAAPRPIDPATLRGTQLRQQDDAANLFVLAIGPDQFAGTLALIALNLCRPGGDRACTVTGFAGTAARVVADDGGRVSWPDRRPDFYYFRDSKRGVEKALWNCATFPRPSAAQCMSADFAAPR